MIVHLKEKNYIKCHDYNKATHNLVVQHTQTLYLDVHISECCWIKQNTKSPQTQSFQSERCCRTFWGVIASGIESPRSSSIRFSTTAVSSGVKNVFVSGKSGIKNQDTQAKHNVIAPSITLERCYYKVTICCCTLTKIQRQPASPARPSIRLNR